MIRLFYNIKKYLLDDKYVKIFNKSVICINKGNIRGNNMNAKIKQIEPINIFVLSNSNNRYSNTLLVITFFDLIYI